MLKRLLRPFGLVPLSEYQIIYRWFEEMRNERDAWQTRVDVLESQVKNLEEALKDCEETLDNEFLTRPPGTTETTAYTDQGKPYPGW